MNRLDEHRLETSIFFKGKASDTFEDAGFLVWRNFIPSYTAQLIHRVSLCQLRAQIPPLEYEADVGYPGAPISREADGGQTARRLLQAHTRHPMFQEIFRLEKLSQWLRSYFGKSVSMTTVHHNCVMTKDPRFGTSTAWHRDSRFWSFGEDDLVTLWVSLTGEEETSGGLHVIPNSHRENLARDRFSNTTFLDPDIFENKHMIESAVSPVLHPGDALIFHSRLLHSAERNLTKQTKFALAFAFHATGNKPLTGTRSATLPSILIVP